jgi:outer membrane protein assembly factor BamB
MSILFQVARHFSKPDSNCREKGACEKGDRHLLCEAPCGPLRGKRCLSPFSLLLAVVFMGLPLGGSESQAADWPHWRYDAGRGAVCPEPLSDDMQLLWRRRLPTPRPAWPESQPWLRFDRSYSPVSGGGKLIVPSMVGDSVTAYAADSGKRLWRFYADGPVRLAPVIDGDRLLFGSDDGCAYCLALEDGSLRWRRRVAPRPRRILGNGRLISTWPLRTGPVLYDDTLYVTAGIWPVMGIFASALDPASGEPRWTNSGQGATYQIQPHNSPAFSGFVPRGHLAASAGGLIAPGGRTPPACYDLATGRLRWFHWLKRGGATSAVSATDRWMFACGTAAGIDDGKPLLPLASPLHDDRAVYSLEDGHLIARSLDPIEKTTEGVDRKGRPKQDTERRLPELWSAALPERLPKAGRLLLKSADRFYLATPGRVAAVRVDAGSDGDEPTAEITWQAEFEGRAWAALAADERLFLVTVEGEIYGFGETSQPPRQYDETEAALAARGASGSRDVGGEAAAAYDWDALAQSMLTISEETEGYALVLGLGSGRLAEAVVRHSQLHVVAVDPDSEKVDAFRRRMDSLGWYGTRAAALACDPAGMELPPYFATLVTSEDRSMFASPATGNEGHPQAESTDEPLPASPATASSASITSVFRRLRPYGGVALLPASEKSVRSRIEENERGTLHGARITSAGPHWSVLRRTGALRGAADWTHQYADAARSVVSADRRVRLPLGLLWFGGPSNDDVLPRHGHGPSPQVAGGRLVIEGRHMLRAIDIYTGRLLWQRELPDLGAFYDFTDHRPGAGMIGSNYVTLADSVYAVFDREILRLDAASGETLSRFALPAGEGDKSPRFGYLGVHGDCLVATADPVAVGTEGFEADQRFASAGRILVVMDRHTGEVLWSRRARYNFRHNNIALAAGKVFCIDGLSPRKQARWARWHDEAKRESDEQPGGSPDGDGYRPRLLALDLRTGEELWSVEDDVFGTFLNYSDEHDVLLQAGSAARDRAPDETRAGMAVYRGANGEVLWKRVDLVHSGPCMLHHDTIITQGPAYDLLTGEPKQRKHPITGESVDWLFTRNYGCNTAIGGEHLLTFRSAAAGFFDLASDGGTGNFGGFKSGCTSNLIPAGGLLNAPEYTRTCTCNYQNQTSLALVHDDSVEVWTFNALRWDGKPVRRVGLNFGAPGDRRDDSGTLWLDWPSTGGPSPDLPLEIEPLEGAAAPRWFRHHSLLVGEPELSAASDGDGGGRWSVEGEPARLAAGNGTPARPWIAASGLIGACRIAIPVSKQSGAGSRRYTVRLHFLEPEGLQPGQRVFDVKVQGETVAERLDVAARVGPMRPFGLAVENVGADETLDVTLEDRTPEAPPVLCGIELIAEDGPETD